MIDLASLATVEQAINHAGNQSVATLGGLQHCLVNMFVAQNGFRCLNLHE
jgi:hypothetical protein